MDSFSSGDVRPEFQAKSSQQPPPYSSNNNRSYLPNGQAPASANPVPGAQPLLPNQGRVIQSGPVRVLCVADVRGKHEALCTRS